MKIKPETFHKLRMLGVTIPVIAEAMRIDKSTIHRRNANGWRRESVEFFCRAATRLTGRRFDFDEVVQ